MSYHRNLDDVPWTPFEHGRVTRQTKAVMAGPGLDCSLVRVMPGHVSSPFHYHEVSEELFIVVEGRGTLRYGNEARPVRAHDVISCPPGPASAHQLINDGDGPLIYYVIGTNHPVEVVGYPDTGKTLVVTPGQGLRAFQDADRVDHWLGET